MIEHQWCQFHNRGASRKASMGMVDIRILGNIQVPERQLHPHHNDHFISNILYITKHRQSSRAKYYERTPMVPIP
jgi:hypothetical protein